MCADLAVNSRAGIVQDGGPWGVHTIHGRESILELSPLLNEFSAVSEQRGAYADLEFILSRPSTSKKKPHLLLFTRDPQKDLKTCSPRDLIGALLIYEYQALGIGARIYATDDSTGRRTLVAPPGLQTEVVRLATRTLLERGAHAVLISYRPEPEDISNALLPPAADGAARYVLRRREIASHLPLYESFDATLAKIGRKTRTNLRYYRRRAITDLGCTFVPQVEISEEEFQKFQSESSFRIPQATTAWRYDSLRQMSSPVFSGIQDRRGRWLSMIGGRRLSDRMELHWQINRDGLPEYSLSTVMRAFLIDHEISLGTRRLYLEGGTQHSLRHSFEPGQVADLLVLRHSLLIALLQRFSGSLMDKDNLLGQMLADPDLNWQTWRS